MKPVAPAPGPDAVDDRIAACLQRIAEAEGVLAQARVALVGSVDALMMTDRMVTFGGNGSTYHTSNLASPVLPWADPASPSLSHAKPFAATLPGVAPVMENTTATAAVLEVSSNQGDADADEVKKPRVLLDQILLDTRPEVHSHMSAETLASNHSGKPTPIGKLVDKGQKSTPIDDAKHAQTHLVHAGKDPETGKPRVIWMDRNHPIWVFFCCRCRMPIWHPESDIRVVWNLVGFVFIVFEAFLIPFYIAFNYQPAGLALKVINVVNTYFILDVVFSFVTGFTDVGIGIMDPGPIALRYLSTWLLPDLLSSIPWEWIPEEHGPFANTTKCFRFLKGVRLMRVTRLMRLMRVGILTDTFEIVIESNRFFVFAIGVLRVLFLLFGITHWTACAWYIIGSNPEDDESKTWIDEFIGGVDDLSIKYFYSVYFALTTMTTVGYGDIVAQNFTEVRFVLLLLLIASIVFAGLMGALTDLICNLSSEGNQRSDRKVMLSRYMRWRAVPKDLFMQVREHLLFIWETNEGYSEVEGPIMDQLPPTLKRELCYHIYGRILRSAPFFAWLRGCDVCVKELSLAVASIFLSKDDHLFKVGQLNEHIYVLLKGTLHISQNVKLDLTPGNASPEDAHLSGTAGFSLPRNKESNCLDVVKMMRKKGLDKQKRRKTQERAKKDEALLLRLNFAPSGDSSSESEQEDAKKGEVDVLESHVDSKLLNSAFNRLRRFDLRQKRSAVVIQRLWRKNHPEAKTSPGETVKRLSTAKSKFVHAPAYFGESCLWAPVEEWDVVPPERYLYSACCETRGEFVYISRSSVKEIIEKFSPWLGDRFAFFQAEVVKNIGHLESRARIDSNTPSPDKGKCGASSKETTQTDAPTTQPSEAPLRVASGEDASQNPSSQPPGQRNYNAVNEMNYAFRGSHGPMAHLKASQSSARSFRAAAAKAVARVAAHVTPPSALPTPVPTPRVGTGTPRNEWGNTSIGRGHQDARTPGNASSISEPLLRSTWPSGPS